MNSSAFKPILVTLLAGGLAAGGAFAAPLGIIFNDTFTDGGTGNGADAQDIAWSWTGGGANLTVTSGEMVATDPTTRDEYLTSASFGATSLDVGQTLRLTLDIRLGQAPRTGLARYGLGFNSVTTPFSPTPDGYSVRFNLGGAASNPDISFLKEIDSQIINSNTGDVTLTPSDANFEPSVGITAFNLLYEITRTGADTMSATFTLTQGANVFTRTATDASGILNSFQSVAIRTDQVDAATGGTFTFDNVKLQVIPEPSTLVLVGLALGGVALLRRRT